MMELVRDMATIVGLVTGLLSLTLIFRQVLPELSFLKQKTSNTGTLAEFSELPPQTLMEESRARDADAKELLGGAGRKEWTILNRTWRIGDVFYFNKGEWVEEVFPESTKQREDASSSCSVEKGGKVTIRGLSETRHAALLQYETSEQTGGADCDTGAFFFHPLPKEE